MSINIWRNKLHRTYVIIIVLCTTLSLPCLYDGHCQIIFAFSCSGLVLYIHILYMYILLQVYAQLIIVRMEEHVQLLWMPIFSASEEACTTLHIWGILIYLLYRCLEATYGNQCQFIKTLESEQYMGTVIECITFYLWLRTVIHINWPFSICFTCR